ncbi:MAG: hypothetical protein HOY44_21580 [Maritimibacter sp.]|uniref:hypothetical protein n=1 Tax=Maritimibacter sp. TaxID=2003363 RepID=UPI001D2DCFE5|nr:hypothetical protein [Maritimibacter sp.]MBL6430116.1 hypothetical protein [Maritimibacter sp.]
MIDFPWMKCARLIFAIVSTTNIPNRSLNPLRKLLNRNIRGSLLDADYPNTGVNLDGVDAPPDGIAMCQDGDVEVTIGRGGIHG